MSKFNLTPKLIERNGMVFQNKEKFNDGLLSHITTYISKSIIDIYLKKMISIETIEDIFQNIKNDKFDIDVLVYHLAFVIRNQGFQKEWKISYKDITIYLSLYDVYQASSGNADLTLHIVIFDQHSKTAVSNMFVLKKDVVAIKDIGCGPIITSQSVKHSRQMYECMKLGKKEYKNTMMNVIYSCMRILSENINKEESQPCHTDVELTIMSDILENMRGVHLVINIFERFNKNYNGDKNFPEKEARKYISNWANGKDTSLYPIVNLTKKEWGLIKNHMTRNGYMREENVIPANNLRTINFNEVIGSMMYGRDFKFLIVANGIEYNIIAEIEKLNDNEIIIHLVYEMEGGRKVFVAGSFENIKRFNFDMNATKIRSDVYISDKKNIASCMDQFCDAIPKMLKDTDLILEIFSRFLALCVIMHDRPNRMKVLRESTTTKVNNHTRNKSQHSRDENVVVRRILKPAKDIKKYIADREKEDQLEIFKNNKITRIYTIDSWNRVAHVRVLKSGKVISIKETECKRRLEISKDKEIHIKL